MTGFPELFPLVRLRHRARHAIPWPFLVFLVLALVLGVVLHGTWIGRNSTRSARTPPLRLWVAQNQLWLFVLSGVVSALAGVILTARFASARPDIGQGMTLTVVTVVLLGGVNIFGGRIANSGRGAGRPLVLAIPWATSCA